ncbi:MULTISPECIES: hypothetical protein [Bacillus]|uniref:hypothetical protein n=1 Tax=Bacillus TaxID=1386 RepID=UPI000BFC8AC4|nr:MULTISPECIES: hypothetical protein [Bacillus]MCR6850043.1 hypothetical protein [Bacillus sp. IBL03825]PGK38675.1 hypothetical protein CN908_17060 [Bacillus thuringiensis]
MFSTKLKKLYEINKIISEEYPFEEYYPLLRNFIAREINLGAEYLSPYRFSLFYGKSPQMAIRLFLGLSDEKSILSQCFKFECEECGSINIIEDEENLIDFKCYECGFEDSLATPNYLSEVKILFKINYEILEEFREDLKENPLSNKESISAVLEEGMDIEISFETAEKMNTKNDSSISKTFEDKVRNILLGDLI